MLDSATVIRQLNAIRAEAISQFGAGLAGSGVISRVDRLINDVLAAHPATLQDNQAVNLELGRRQAEAFNWILGFHLDHGYSPTSEEICVGIGINTRAGAKYHLDALECKGLIRRNPNIPRSIVFLHNTPIAVTP